jgi:DNA-directed RNA polymerase specialized sigma24 family protein
MILETLAKKDKYWRQVAFNISKDKNIADDLVQEMYLKIYRISLKKELEINDYYVVRILLNTYLDYLKENKKTISIETITDLESRCLIFEPTDKEKFILDNLTFLEKEILTLKQDVSYHEIQRKFNINYQFARRIVLEAQNKYGKKKTK